MPRVVGLIFVILVNVTCGSETQHSLPSFIALEHDHGGRYTYLNMLIDHVHDTTWHISYSSDVERNFEPAIETALQLWLQPLRDMGLRDIVDDFKFYHHREGDYPSSVPWSEVLFRIFFSSSSGGNLKGLYRTTHVNKGEELETLKPEWLPILTVYNVGESKENFATDSFFMFVLVHEMGHGFGLADIYEGTGGEGRRGSQPLSVMAADYPAFNYPPVLPPGKGIELTTDDIKGLIWLYKKYVEQSIKDIADCYHNDYKYEDSPPGCVPGTPPTEPEPQPPPINPPTTEPSPPTEPLTCADDPCADACLTSCIYRSCGSRYANPSDRYRTSCYSRDDGQWCGSAGQGRTDVCRAKAIKPQPPTSDPPTEPQPPATNDIAAQCCNEGFSCAAWPGKADIFLCNATPQGETMSHTHSPCCQTDAYECEAWPGRAVAAVCFGR